MLAAWRGAARESRARYLSRGRTAHSPFPARHESGEFLQIALADAAALLANNSRGLERAPWRRTSRSLAISSRLRSEYVPVTEPIPDLEWEIQPKSTTVTTVPDRNHCPPRVSKRRLSRASGHCTDPINWRSAGSPEQHRDSVPEAESFSSEEFPSTAYPALAETAAAPSTSEAHSQANSTRALGSTSMNCWTRHSPWIRPNHWRFAAANPSQESSELRPRHRTRCPI